MRYPSGMLTVVVMIVGCGAGGEQPPVGLPDASVPVDTEAPVIVSISPPDGALGIGEDAVVVITFSEPMDRLSVQDSVAAAPSPKNRAGKFPRTRLKPFKGQSPDPVIRFAS